jgi:hypothetical protein
MITYYTIRQDVVEKGMIKQRVEVPTSFTWYLIHTGWEELIFRYGVIGLLTWSGLDWKIIVLISGLVWAWSHYIGFRLQMVAVCFVLGLILGWLYIGFILWSPLNGIVCLGIHVLIGWLGIRSGIIPGWIRE